jgi:serine/threonine protein kinase
VEKPKHDPNGTVAGKTGTESVSSFSSETGDQDPRPQSLPSGTLIADRYRITAELGRGGYAVVYRAREVTTGQEVALKILKAERLGAVALKRLAREAETAKQFNHPNLVRLLDHGRDGDHAFLAMELVDGETLRARLARGPATASETVRVAADILGALSALHHKGIVHRDVKPSNILLEARGCARLADLGLVTRSADDQTRATESHTIVGTLEYVSPEQALGEELDGRSDLYSLGVVLHEMLSGAPLHGSRSSLGALVAHLTKPAPDLRASSEDVPDWLAGIVAKLLAKSRDERYKDAQGVLDDLDARRIPASGAKKDPRGWRVAVGALAALVLVAGAGAWRRVSTGRSAPAPQIASAEVKEGVLRAIDSTGRVVWTHNFGFPLNDAAYSNEKTFRQRTLMVTDLEGDGTSEVLIVTNLPAEGQSRLVALNADGSIRFERRPGRPVTYGKELAERFNANMVDTFTDASGRLHLLLVGNHERFFPSVLEDLDPSGKPIRQYFAAGHQTSLVRIQAGPQELIALGGYHNETRGASVTLLGLNEPWGHAPGANPAYVCSDCAATEPRALLVFPRSDVLRALSGPQGSATVGSILAVERGELDVTTHHGASDDGTSPPEVLGIGYTISAELSRVVDFRPPPHLGPTHDRLFKRGALDHRFGQADLDALKRVVRWDGRRWAPLALDAAVR